VALANMPGATVLPYQTFLVFEKPTATASSGATRPR
jgi:hypothetical protein